MKNLWLIVVLLMVRTTFSFGAKGDKAYTGEIMDSTCAKMGNHDAGYKLTGTSTPKDCTEACVKSGAKYALYNASTAEGVALGRGSVSACLSRKERDELTFGVAGTNEPLSYRQLGEEHRIRTG